MRSMTTTRRLIIFTDLDGTLLDRETYSFKPAEPALRKIRERGIPLILCSSKTRAEMELYRERIGNHHPFISENGGGIFIPRSYFSFPYPYDRETNGYLVLEVGTPYHRILQVLSAIKKETRVPIKGFSDLSPADLVRLFHLKLQEAEFAKKREYDEPFLIEGSEMEAETVRKKIHAKGMNYAWGGRLHHLTGGNDKGKAIEILKKLYRNEFFSIETLGIGDSLNDVPMFQAVDLPIFLRGNDACQPEIPFGIENLVTVDGIGPHAWNEAILKALETADGRDSKRGKIQNQDSP